MKKLVLFLVFLFCAVSVALAEGTGNLMIALPNNECQVILDNKVLDIGGKAIISEKVPVGLHSLVVKFTEEDTSVEYNDFSVAENLDTFINVPFKEKGVGAGFGVGIDGANYRFVGVNGDTSQYELSPQYDLTWFYTAPIRHHCYFDFSVSLGRPTSDIQVGGEKKPILAVLPIQVGVKYKVNKYLMFGYGINYSIWSFGALDKINTSWHSGVFGYQIKFEILPISTEIGYTLKTQRIYGANSEEFADYISSGLYFMYKLYL